MRRMLSLSLALALAASVGTAAGQTAGPQKMERPGITNYTKVDAVVACGGATDTTALEGLKHDGFRTVVNLRMPTEPGANIEENMARAKALGLHYVSIPFNGQSPDPTVFDRFMDTVSNTANQPVYIHCASANRVGAAWMVKRVLQDGWPVEKALDEAKLIGLTSAPLQKLALDYIESKKK